MFARSYACQATIFFRPQILTSGNFAALLIARMHGTSFEIYILILAALLRWVQNTPILYAVYLVREMVLPGKLYTSLFKILVFVL